MQKPNFYMLSSFNPHGEDSNDDILIVIVNSSVNNNALKAFRTNNPWVGCVAIEEDDARKLLQERNGIGVGCYTLEASNDAVGGLSRRIMARSALDSFCTIVRGFQTHSPYLLTAPKESSIEKPTRELLSLRY